MFAMLKDRTLNLLLKVIIAYDFAMLHKQDPKRHLSNLRTQRMRNKSQLILRYYAFTNLITYTVYLLTPRHWYVFHWTILRGKL